MPHNNIIILKNLTDMVYVCCANEDPSPDIAASVKN
jgi:hypothetical protein